PGAYVHATAINNLMRHNEVREVGHVGVAIVATAFSALIALAVLMLAPIGAVAVYVVTALAWGAATTAMFNQGVALPLVQPAVAGLFGLAATIGYRFVGAGPDKRPFRQGFGAFARPAGHGEV